MDESHIIEMAFDLFDNIDFRDPRKFYPWAKEQIIDLKEDVSTFWENIHLVRNENIRRDFFVAGLMIRGHNGTIVQAYKHTDVQ